MHPNISSEIEADTKNKLLMRTFLFILLGIRIFLANPYINLTRFLGISGHEYSVQVFNSLQLQTDYLWFSWSFIFIGTVAIINRNDLRGLNIDKTFIAIYLLGSLSYWMYENRFPYGWLGVFLAIVMCVLFRKRDFRFATLEPNAKSVALIAMMMFLLIVWMRRDSFGLNTALWLFHSAATDIPFVLSEEVIFRGLLWKFLEDFNFPAPKIIGIQALLFWFSHIDSITEYPIFFWIITPIAGIVLGAVVWRAKSITISFFAHILANFLIRLY